MIYSWACNRREFVDYIASHQPLLEKDLRKHDVLSVATLQKDDMVLAWPERPTHAFSLPRAIVVSDEAKPEFLAWVSTYIRHIRPFTAHCRVLTSGNLDLIQRDRSGASVLRTEDVDIGLIVAEALAHSVGRTEALRLPFSAFARTLSFSIAQSAKQYPLDDENNNDVLEVVKDGWTLTRSLSDQVPLDLLSSTISEVWSLLLRSLTESTAKQRIAEPDAQIIEAIRSVHDTGQIPASAWDKLAGQMLNDQTKSPVWDGPREGRVRAAELAMSELSNGTSSTRRSRAFLAGYIASRIEPGTLDHLPLLFPVLANLRESILWYGACSGLAPDTTLDAYGNGVGLLLKRELRRPAFWLDRPDCDIALAELTLLLRNRQSARPNFPTLASGVLKVEVFPLVYTSVRWSEAAEDSTNSRNVPDDAQKTLFDSETKTRHDVLEILRRIEDASLTLSSIEKQVEKAFGQKSPKDRRRRR